MSKLIFTESAWNEYLYWQLNAKIMLKRINALQKDINRQSYDVIGKPELLKYNLVAWSRRIDGKYRLVYRVSNSQIEILQCKGHYDE